MVINWYGQSCFRLQAGNLVVFIDPFAKSIGLSPPRGEADLVLVSHQHADHNNVKALKGSPFLVDGPGEYEYKGVKILGIDSFHDQEEGKERGSNTMYKIVLEGMSILHAGDLGQAQLSPEQLDRIGGADIMMLPVGGHFTIGADEAAKIVAQLEPRIVIPMHYKVQGLKVKLEDPSRFLSNLGAGDVKAQDKLTIKKNTLPQERMEVVVLKI